MGQLPPGAVVIERAPVRADRELVLWMVKPERFDRGPNTNDNPYTCPERTRGHHYIGPTRVSLVEPATKRVLNTVLIHPYEEDSFDVPYRIVPDYYYRVPGAKPGEEGTPKLLDLRDFNGDGLPLEAAFYEAQACMGLLTTLVGYSPKQDRVVQYAVELRVTGDGRRGQRPSPGPTICFPTSPCRRGDGCMRSTTGDGPDRWTPTTSVTIRPASGSMGLCGRPPLRHDHALKVLPSAASFTSSGAGSQPNACTLASTLARPSESA